MFELDHLAVASRTLEEGRAWVEDMLGVALQPGGKHAHFGTHNLLLGLEDGLYLEVIAIDPDAPPQGYPRWFDLDRFTGPPRITNWIARTDSLETALARYPEGGTPVALSRGDLRWQMMVPDDGILPCDGAFPALIEWQCDTHPARRLNPSGCRLRQFVIRHPKAAELQSKFADTLSDDRILFETGDPELRAEFITPEGIRVLS